MGNNQKLNWLWFFCLTSPNAEVKPSDAKRLKLLTDDPAKADLPEELRCLSKKKLRKALQKPNKPMSNIHTPGRGKFEMCVHCKSNARVCNILLLLPVVIEISPVQRYFFVKRLPNRGISLTSKLLAHHIIGRTNELNRIQFNIMSLIWPGRMGFSRRTARANEINLSHWMNWITWLDIRVLKEFSYLWFFHIWQTTTNNVKIFPPIS